MKSFFKIFLLFALISAVSSPVFAYKPMKNVSKKQVNQNERIRQGVRSGELTKEEAKELKQDQKEIRKMKQEARSDGKVTVQERKEIQKKLNQESKEIYQEKHDEQKR
ncbi:MAG: hypothetical protein NT145_04240 [Elusimicrobia bacterium]|nr:hypothetical protein [Elusimicrobiota bacterium]